MNAARLLFSSLRFDHITPLLRQLHWLKASERIAFKCAILVYKCLHGSAPSYLVIDELCQVADVEACQRLRSASSSLLIIGHTRLSAVVDRAFLVAAVHIWNNLPQHVTSAPLMLVFWSRLRSCLFYYFLSQSVTMYSSCTVTLVISDTITVHVPYLLI